MSRKTSRWLIPLLTVSSGALMIFVGSLVRGDYAPQVWVQLGSTVVLFGPLYWLQWIFERGVSEVRQQTQETRSSVEHLSHDIETIRQQAVSGLDDLRDVAGLLNRAWELGGISDSGVRVHHNGTTLRLRFPLNARSDNGSSPALGVGLEEENATVPHDATAPGAAVRGQLPVPWSARQRAGDWAASLASQLQRLNRYPGDEQFDPAGALGQLMRLLRVAIEARTRPPSASPPMSRLKPV